MPYRNSLRRLETRSFPNQNPHVSPDWYIFWNYRYERVGERRGRCRRLLEVPRKHIAPNFTSRSRIRQDWTQNLLVWRSASRRRSWSSPRNWVFKVLVEIECARRKPTSFLPADKKPRGDKKSHATSALKSRRIAWNFLNLHKRKSKERQFGFGSRRVFELDNFDEKATGGKRTKKTVKKTSKTVHFERNVQNNKMMQEKWKLDTV